MMIIYGTNGNETLALTNSQINAYGLEDDRVAGFGGADIIKTGAGNDHLDGGLGDDVLYDGDGNDTVVAGAGNDSVQVDAGNDIYHGGAGIDRLYFDSIHYGAQNTYEDAYGGIKLDLALTSAQNLGEFGFDSFFGFENVYGTYGHDTIFGSAEENTIEGYDGNDQLYGRGGNDTLYGDGGADILAGDSGDDALFGGDGADTLTGGLGRDEIDLGGKMDSIRDVVRYTSLKDSGAAAATRDLIYDFQLGLDKIDLSKLDANLSLKGNQAFKMVTGFTKALGEVKLVKQGNDTLVQIDGDKDAAVDMTILVLGAHLTKGDFIL